MFTDKAVKSLKPKKTAYKIFENGPDKGFCIQVSKNAKTFYMQYLSPITGNKRFFKLGTYPDTSLAVARKRCQAARDLVSAGKDPSIERDLTQTEERAAEADRRRQAELERSTGTVTDLFETYIGKLRAEGKRSWKDVQQIFRKDIQPQIGSMKARDVQPEQVTAILRTILNRGARIVASHTRSHIMAAYNFGKHADIDATINSQVRFCIQTNPAVDIPVPARVQPGNTHLSARQVKNLWHRLDQSPMSHGMKTALRLLFATGGQRVEEVLQMQWSHLDFEQRLWTIPTTKNGSEHTVPLSDLAVELIESMRPLSSARYVFPHRDDPNRPTPHTSLSQSIRRFLESEQTNSSSEDEVIPKFIPKDIRRTVKSRMGELSISKELRDRLQNHALQDVSSKHYDRYSYLPEKRRAMIIWTQWLKTLVFAKDLEQNVIPISQIAP